MKIRNQVTFTHPAPFIPCEDEAVFGTAGAGWFVDLLKRVPGLTVNDKLCQEDWGVVVFAERNSKKFWIGIAPYDEHEWIAHFHHGSFAWLQRISASGQRELKQVIADFHALLRTDPAVSEIGWHRENSQLDAPSPSPEIP